MAIATQGELSKLAEPTDRVKPRAMFEDWPAWIMVV